MSHTPNTSEDQKKYDREEIERLFFQMDNLLHTRINSLLVAETIFFMATASNWRRSDWS